MLVFVQRNTIYFLGSLWNCEQKIGMPNKIVFKRNITVSFIPFIFLFLCDFWEYYKQKKNTCFCCRYCLLCALLSFFFFLFFCNVMWIKDQKQWHALFVVYVFVFVAVFIRWPTKKNGVCINRCFVAKKKNTWTQTNKQQFFIFHC